MKKFKSHSLLVNGAQVSRLRQEFFACNLLIYQPKQRFRLVAGYFPCPLVRPENQLGEFEVEFQAPKYGDRNSVREHLIYSRLWSRLSGRMSRRNGGTLVGWVINDGAVVKTNIIGSVPDNWKIANSATSTATASLTSCGAPTAAPW